MLSLLFGKSDPSREERKFEAGSAYFTIPSLIDSTTKHFINADVSSCIYGTMDERGLCFISYFAIFWSKHEISDSLLIPSRAYHIKSRSTSAAVLPNGQSVKVIAIKISAVKPCGKLVNEDLRSVKFFRKETNLYYVISGFVKPFLPYNQLLTVANSFEPVNKNR
jgi:hypothetical protein